MVKIFNHQGTSVARFASGIDALLRGDYFVIDNISGLDGRVVFVVGDGGPSGYELEVFDVGSGSLVQYTGETLNVSGIGGTFVNIPAIKSMDILYESNPEIRNNYRYPNLVRFVQGELFLERATRDELLWKEKSRQLYESLYAEANSLVKERKVEGLTRGTSERTERLRARMPLNYLERIVQENLSRQGKTYQISIDHPEHDLAVLHSPNLVGRSILYPHK